MSEKNKLLRRSQSLSPFGVGSVIDQEGESFVPTDITRWHDHGDPVREPRLEAFLGVTGFRSVPSAPQNPLYGHDDHPGVPCVRFPAWLFCPNRNCRRMSYLPFQVDRPVCQYCSKHPPLVPMRFILACPHGHLSDMDWVWWAHSNSRSGKCENSTLVFRTHPGGSGLEFVDVFCLSCEKGRSLKGIASRDSLMPYKFHCPGTQPWQTHDEKEDCDAVPQILQRGATNLTFASIVSSIDIPPFSSLDPFSDDLSLVMSQDYYKTAVDSYKRGNTDMFEGSIGCLAEDLNWDVERVREIVMSQLNDNAVSRDTPRDNESLLYEEYQAFLSPDRDYQPRERFIKRRVRLAGYPDSSAPASYSKAVELVKERLGMLVQVTRLREVRASQGFSRLSPNELSPGEDDDQPGSFSVYGSGQKIRPRLVPADLGAMPPHSKWLPAIEVFGEGIFFTLNEGMLSEWESRDEVRKHIAVLAVRREHNASYLPVPSPRLVLLHTLSHLLIRQLSFDCGYSIASLRERLYSRDPGGNGSMAGILIYTAAGDTEGTLGGLVRQGRLDRMLPSMLKALQNADWCSSDPLCRESTGQGLYALNLAACHACSLLPETSCILSNRLLDRTLLLGNSDDSVPGFFSPLMKHIVSVMSF